MIRERYLWVIAAVANLAGCERAPSINILGAFFPAWMLCIVTGIVLTLVLRALLVAIGLDEHVGPRGITYPASMVLFTLATWLLFFEN